MKPSSSEELFLEAYSHERVDKIQMIKAEIESMGKSVNNWKNGEEKTAHLILDSLQVMENDNSPMNKDKYYQEQQLFMAFTAWTKAKYSYNERYLASVAIEQAVKKHQSGKISEESKDTINKNEAGSKTRQGLYGLGIVGCIMLTPVIPYATVPLGLYLGYRLNNERYAQNTPNSPKEVERCEKLINAAYQKGVLRYEVEQLQNQHNDEDIAELIINKATKDDYASHLNAFEKILRVANTTEYNSNIHLPNDLLKQLNSLLRALKEHTSGNDNAVDAQMMIILKNNLELLKTKLTENQRTEAIEAIKDAYEKLDNYKAPKTRLGSILPGAASIGYGVAYAAAVVIPAAVASVVFYAATIAARIFIAEKLDVTPVGATKMDSQLFPFVEILEPMFDVYRYYFKKSMLEGTSEHAARQVAHSYREQAKSGTKPVENPIVQPQTTPASAAASSPAPVQTETRPTNASQANLNLSNSTKPPTQATVNAKPTPTATVTTKATNGTVAAHQAAPASTTSSGIALSTGTSSSTSAVTSNAAQTAIPNPTAAVLQQKISQTAPITTAHPPVHQDSSQNPQANTQIAPHAKSVSPPAILPATEALFESYFLSNLNAQKNSNASSLNMAIKVERTSNNGYILKSLDGNNELPKLQLEIFKDGKVSASNQPRSPDEQKILAEKMVAAFLTAGNTMPGPADLKCSDPILHGLISTKLKENGFEIMPPLIKRAASQRDVLQDPTSTQTFNRAGSP